MADEKIKISSLPTATEVEDNDYILISNTDTPASAGDTTAGSRKILASDIGGGGGSSIAQYSMDAYMALSTETKNNGTLYMVSDAGSNYIYYMSNLYAKTSKPITLESDNTAITTTSTSAVTLEEGYHYFFSTVYSGSNFSGATIEAGGARAFNIDGYDRVLTIIRADQASVQYPRAGTISPNYFIKFRIKQGTEYNDGLEFKNGTTAQSEWSTSTSPTINVKKGEHYMITYKGYDTISITGANVICSCYIGDADSKKSVSALITATANTITVANYTVSNFYYLELKH